MMKLRIRSSSRVLLHSCASGRSSSAPAGAHAPAAAPAGADRVLPLHEELLRRAGGAVAQSLRVAARQHELHGAEEALVEDLFLVGDELAHAVGQLHRAALELDHRDGEAVEIEHDVWPALIAALQRHLFGQREVVLLRVLPVDQVHRLVRLTRSDLHRHAVAQELVGAQVGLVERDAGRVGGGLQLLQSGGDVAAE